LKIELSDPMTRRGLAESPPPGKRPDAEELLYQFDQAWQRGAPPSFETYLRALPQSSGPARRQFLEELVKIDLECRWRLKPKGCNPWTLEEYVKRYPELGPLAQVALELIGEEYRVRHRFGDRPGHAEYLARFASKDAGLKEALGQVDRQLAGEPMRHAGVGVRHAHTSESQGATPALPATACETAAGLMDALRQGRLLSQSQLDELVQGTGTRVSEPRSLAAQLVQRDWLTPYQANQLLLGRASELAIGPYVLLERLGEGGTGQVFKARHQLMQRVVALKIIRKELLTDDEVVQRFQREVQLVSQLTHPNIVHAYDAGPLGTTFCLVMEYVEGISLGRLVKQQGPLSIEQASDFIRQAALGLQHIHERGLVHRDIKPPNLIVSSTRASATAPTAAPVAVLAPAGDAAAAQACTPAHPWGVVKILDLGLARLPRQVSGEETNLLTPTRAMMMGTPDYLAPEQAFDFHQADIRADIYSLGCTFFFLLTGQPPFPGGTLTEKLLRHQSVEPPGVEKIRRGVPAPLANAVRRMLAKRPADRYQTPAEVADVLAGYAEQSRAAGSAATKEGQVPARAPHRRGFGRLLQALPGQSRWQLLAAVVGIFSLIGVILYFSKAPPLGWTVLDAHEYRAASGATLTKLPDRSLLASGTVGQTDSYTIVAHTDRVGITAIRLELWPHASLPQKGPGRHSTGNLVLSELRLLAAPRKDPAAAKAVALVNAASDFDQQGWEVAKAVDGNPETGWAILPEAGKPHWAVFETKEPIGFRGGTTLTFILDQNYPFAPLGCWRLSITTAPRPIRTDRKLPDLDR
jgi:serine/threonine-protein kinase